ncbi:small, acid-soluble spore protein, alpha/beta type [Anaerobacillus sp. MEB173]|uniref:small, acid-soluble spore protein, alpha/beta type n=1 Tax=Anaerobacillus sp. MEB173 TaxID=3383345 RepID=UPI003F8E2A8C
MRNPLIVPEGEQFLQQYKEEIAHEFGIHRSVLESEMLTEVTKRITEEAKKEDEKNKNKE